MRALSQGWIGAVCCGVIALAGCGSGGPVIVSSPTPPQKPPGPTPILVTAKAKFAYVGNQGASLSGYSVDTTTGALTGLDGFPRNLGENPTVVAVDPQNRFLFAGDIAASLLHVFTINSTTGALSELADSPYATVQEPVGIAVDPSGTHVYVAGQGSNAIGGFSLSSTGALTPIDGSPFATSGSKEFGRAVRLNAAGTVAYVQDLDNVYVFSVDASSAALKLVQTIAGPASGDDIALDPHGTYLYAVGAGSNSILAYSISASSGLLTAAASSPMVEQDGAYTISISPTGLYAYTIERSNYLVSYTLDGGVFKPVGSAYSPVYGQKIGVDPSGRFVYVPQACSNCPGAAYNVINEFSIGSTGALTRLSGSPVAAGTMPWGIAFTTQ